MNTIKRSALLPHSQEQMFNLVSDISSYQDFLPWCSDTTILEENLNQVVATLHIEHFKVKTKFTTKNTILRPNSMLIELVDGPFKYLQGSWQFTKLDENSCKIDFCLEYTFSNIVLELALGPVFKYITQSIMDAFIKQANLKFSKNNVTN